MSAPNRTRQHDHPTPAALEILLALSDGRGHGYAIMREVEDRTGGAVRLRPGTMYRAIARLVDSGAIEESENRGDPSEDDERRRYYHLTGSGRTLLKRELHRLASVVNAARAKDLLGEGDLT